MKKIILTFAFVLIFASIGFARGGGGGHHGGGNSPDPGHNGGGQCVIDKNLHNETNVSCDGTNQQVGAHHRGTTVNADLPSNHDFVGGFCLSADVLDGNALSVDCARMGAHDKIWLCSGDNIYYPITQNANDKHFDVLDNGWADRNPARGQVEADVLFSKASGNDPVNSGGGGCNSFSVAVLFVLFIPVMGRMGKFLHKFSTIRS